MKDSLDMIRDLEQGSAKSTEGVRGQNCHKSRAGSVGSRRVLGIVEQMLLSIYVLHGFVSRCDSIDHQDCFRHDFSYRRVDARRRHVSDGMRKQLAVRRPRVHSRLQQRLTVNFRTKYQDKQCVENCGTEAAGQPMQFEQPVSPHSLRHSSF
jgi:hypothetical protein